MNVREPRGAGARREVRSPWDDRIVGSVPVADRAEVERAIETASRAHASHRAAPTPLHVRAEVLDRAAAIVRDRRDDLARVVSDEAGKPIALARNEVDRCVDTLQTARDVARAGEGELRDLSAFASAADRLALVRRFPVGPIAAITPFNFPLNLVAHKLAPAVAAGCPVVLKPSPQAPLSGFALADILREAGLREDSVSVVACSNEDAAPLVEDERIAMLSFTGSAPVGWALRARAGHKRVALELGGNAAVIVHDDADLDRAADRIANGAFAYAGQSCISVQRVLVQRRIEAALLERLRDRMSRVPTGDPARDEIVCGPVIDDVAVRRIESVLGEAIAAGARATEEPRFDRRVLRPLLLERCPEGVRARRDEIFAPVALVDPYDDFDRALDAADAGVFGLQAGVFTADLGRVLRAWERLEVGGVLHDDVPTFRADAMPYGGSKRSGLGREGPRHAWLEMTEPRVLLLRR